METLNNKKIAIVSGAFGYVGRAICEELIKDNWHVAMLYHRTKDEERDSLLTMLGGKAFAYQCDLTHIEEVVS